MNLVFVSPESASIDLTRRAGPRIGFLLHSADKLGWRLSWSATQIESGMGDIPLAPQDIVISDLPHTEWSSLRNRQAIRTDDFFRISMRGLREEWGLQDESPTEALRTLDPALRRVLSILQQVAVDMGVDDGVRLYGARKASSFFTDAIVKTAGYVGVQQEDQKNVSMSLSGAYAAGVSPQMAAKAPPREVFSFRKPSLTVLRDLVNAAIPAGDWRAVGHPAGQPIAPDIVTQILDLKLPTLFQVNWRPTPRVGVDIALMRATLRYLGWENMRKEPRDWTTLDEMMMLNKVVDVSVMNAFVAEEWKSPSFGASMLDSLRAFASGWCVDIAAHNLVASMTTRNAPPLSPSPLSVWTTTRDRIAMTPVISSFTNAGFPVVSAYLGGVRIHCPPARREDAIKLAWSLGLTPPLSLSMQMSADEDAPARVHGDEIDGARWGGERDMLAYAALRANGDFEGLLAIDDIVDEDEDRE